jgi:NADH-quinone oxidoreductase subunit N
LLLIALAGSGGHGEWHFFSPGWMPVLAIMAAASMAIGNFAAVVQSDVKRLMAYSAIAHSGYALLGVLANNGQGISALIFYMITYGLTLVGTFGAIALVEQSTGGSKLSDFAGLGRREPALGLCLMIFMLSLAGIPPLAGFFGKFYVFTAVVQAGQNLGYLWLVMFAIATSAVSLYYYLKVLKQIYVIPAPEGSVPHAIPFAGKLVIYVIALLIVVIGCVPTVILNPLLPAIKFFGW